MSAHFIVTVDGLPYYAATYGCPAPLAWSPGDDEPKGAAILEGAIVQPVRWAWSDRMRVTSGELESEGVTLGLHDIKAPYGVAIGRPWLTYLTTRDALSLSSAVVAASFDAGALTFAVDTSSASAIASAIPGVVWVDDEAILCDAIDLGTGVVTVATDGRGYYGTRDRDHHIDVDAVVYPEAWTVPGWTARRRVLLWRVDAGRTATVVRRLYANRPRISRDGASFDLQCEHAWTVERARALGVPNASTRVRGYSTRAVGFGAQVGHLFPDDTTRAQERYFTTLDELLGWARPALAANLLAPSTEVTAADVALRRVGTQRRVLLSIRTKNAKDDSLSARIVVLGEVKAASVVKVEPQQSDLTADLPNGAILLPEAGTGDATCAIPVTTVATLPATFAGPAPRIDGAHTTTSRAAMFGTLSESQRLAIYPASASANDATIRGPVVTGTYRLFDPVSGRTIQPEKGLRVPVTGSPRLVLGAEVDTTHWAYGLAHVLTDTAHVRAEVDARNFDTGSLDAVADATESEVSARRWALDGSTALDSLLTATLAAEGCCPAVLEHGRVGFVAIRPPCANESVAASFSSATLVAGSRVEWTTQPDGIVNAAELRSGRDTILVRDTRSVQRYGVGRTAKAELAGVDSTALEDLRSVALRALSRVVQVWGDPCSVVRFTVPLPLAERVYLGSFVSITDATAPNGTGDRGNAARIVQVITTNVDIGASTMTIEGVALPPVYGYAPAIKVAAISGATITADYQYVLEGSASATDYAGTTTGSAGPCGVDRFTAGDRVKLLLRDSTTYDYYSAVVQSVSAGTRQITLTASVPTSPTDWPTLAGTGWVDLVFDDYETSGVQDSQKLYAVCGGGNTTTGEIGSSGDPSRRWAP